MKASDSSSARLIQTICLIVFLVVSGCYTIIKHPEEPKLVTEEGVYRDCIECHQEGGFHHYDPYSYGGYYDFYPPLWQHYYARPWWYREHWYYVPPASDDDEGQYEMRPVRRGLWSRGGTGIPFVGGDTQSTDETRQEVASDDSKKKESDTKKKDDKEEKKRRLWRR